MKRLFSIFLAICLCSICVFAAEQGDEYDDGYVYEQNGAGDQYIKFGINGMFPLNFGNQLSTGGAIDIGYYRFMSSKIAVGGEATLSYNISIGHEPLYMIPITFGAMFMPSVGNFEFPLTAGIGFGLQSWANMTYFPSLAAKASAGTFYRFTETFSLGAETAIMCIPQWVKDSSKNYTGLFATLNITAKFHF